MDPVSAMVFAIAVTYLIRGAFGAGIDQARTEARQAARSIRAHVQASPHTQRLAKKLDEGHRAGHTSGWWWGWAAVRTARGTYRAIRATSRGVRHTRGPLGRIVRAFGRGARAGWIHGRARQPYTRIRADHDPQTCPACGARTRRAADAPDMPAGEQARPSDPEPGAPPAEHVPPPTPGASLPSGDAAPATAPSNGHAPVAVLERPAPAEPQQSTEEPVTDTTIATRPDTDAGTDLASSHQAFTGISGLCETLASMLDSMIGNLNAVKASPNIIQGAAELQDMAAEMSARAQAVEDYLASRQDPVAEAHEAAGGEEHIAEPGWYEEA
jgi:hypothetical protein